jgi:hypothetical protein
MDTIVDCGGARGEDVDVDQEWHETANRHIDRDIKLKRGRRVSWEENGRDPRGW